MKILPPFARPAWLAAILAAILFAAAVALALALVPGWQPGQHPLALLARLAAPTGPLLAAMAFVGPGLLMALSTLLRPRPPRRLAGVVVQLQLLSAAGLLLMGLLPLPTGPADGAGRAHALAWMLWLAAAVAAMALDGLEQLRQQAWLAALAGLAGAGLLALLCLGNWLPLPGALAQLLGWSLWLGWGAWLARRAQL